MTFDDDDRSHHDHALPVLQDLDVPATFFLSGRSLHGLGPYWWNRLEGLIRHDGLSSVGNRLGITATTPADLAARIEGTALVEKLDTAKVIDVDQPLSGTEIRSLAKAGMEVGFHTISHPVLLGLPDAEVDRHLTEGVTELAEAAGCDITYFAYPHGKADRHLARRVEDAGFSAAFVEGGRPLHPDMDRYLLGRWGPGPADIDDFMAGVALRLSRPNRM
ncbi:MAG: polysaccharide deacetylase family protein [Acidimicrobiia bacterium]|nr:polysaccharide deacetylase family protein [Acidimicrobiia bacterium]